MEIRNTRKKYQKYTNEIFKIEKKNLL